MDTSIFKAYDIRGIYPEQINRDVCYNIARAFSNFIKDFYNTDSPKIVVGYDIRKSSKELFEGLTQGLMDKGVQVIDIGLCSTPLNYFANWKLKADASIMLTASHNPKEYNGLKFSLRGVMALAEINGIEKLKEFFVLPEPREKSFPLPQSGQIEHKRFADEYIEFLASKAGDFDFSEFKIALDCGNGMVGPLFEKLARTLNLNYQGLFMTPDGDFPNHGPDPLDKKALEGIQSLMKKEKFYLGVIFDGDGDRFMALGSDGELISSDFLLGLFAQYFLPKIKNKNIPCDARVSRGVREIIEESGGKVIKTKVGYPYLRKMMREKGAFLGGEISGHFFWQDFSFAESGLLSLVQLLEILKEKGQLIEKLIEPMKRYFNSGEINFEVEDREKKIKEIEKKYQDGEIFHLDGSTVEYSDWWFNLRPSKTEPILRLIVEANSQELLEEKVKELQRII